MSEREFFECFERLREHLDKFIKKSKDNEEMIKNYMLIISQLKENLQKQEEELKNFENSNIVEIWKKHIIENKRYGFSELAKEIEDKIEEFDKKLKAFIDEKESIRKEILKANKKGV